MIIFYITITQPLSGQKLRISEVVPNTADPNYCCRLESASFRLGPEIRIAETYRMLTFVDFCSSCTGTTGHRRSLALSDVALQTIKLRQSGGVFRATAVDIASEAFALVLDPTDLTLTLTNTKVTGNQSVCDAVAVYHVQCAELFDGCLPDTCAVPDPNLSAEKYHLSDAGITFGVLTTIFIVLLALLIFFLVLVFCIVARRESMDRERTLECARNTLLICAAAHAHAGYPFDAECASDDNRDTAHFPWKFWSTSFAAIFRACVAVLSFVLWIAAAASLDPLDLPSLREGYHARDWGVWMLLLGLVVWGVHILIVANLFAVALMLALPCPDRLSIQKHPGDLPKSKVAQFLSGMFQWTVSFPLFTLLIDGALFCTVFVTVFGAGTWSKNTNDGYVLATVCTYVSKVYF